MTAGPGFPRFSGGFKTFRVGFSTNREKGTDDGLIVYSSGSRTVTHRYLWLKFLWDQLTKEEWNLFLAMPETLNSNLMYDTIRAMLILPKKKVRERLMEHPISNEERYHRISYQGIKGLRLEIYKESRRLPKVPKFSGYVKSASAIGSKSRKGPSFLEPLAINADDYTDFSFNWYSYLTVGG